MQANASTDRHQTPQGRNLLLLQTFCILFARFCVIFNVLKSLYVLRVMHLSSNPNSMFPAFAAHVVQPNCRILSNRCIWKHFDLSGLPYKTRPTQTTMPCFCLSLSCYWVCSYWTDKEASPCYRVPSRCTSAVINANNFCSMSLRSIGAVENSDLITPL